MRVFRCFYILLGLTFCVFQASCNSICGTKFTDAASSAHLADIVLEGQVTVTGDLGRGNYYNVSLRVPSRRKIFKVYKDASGSVQRVLEKSRGVIKVGEFGDQENKDACVSKIVRRMSYVFFLRATESAEYFRLSAFPISTSGSKKAGKKLRRTLKTVVCKNCAKAPKITKNIKSLTVKEGSKIALKCAAKGNPKPKISWEKNGRLLSKAKGMRIKYGKKGSRLQYRRASRRAEGEYKCVAENVVGRVEKSFTITVIRKTGTKKPGRATKPTPTTTVKMETSTRFQLCDKIHDGFCLHGGVCWYSSYLEEKFCKCNQDFSGKRCEYRDVFSVFGPFETKAKLERDRTLIIIGIVIACLVFIVICILSYYLAKQKRTSFYKRREERKREAEPYKPLLRDEVDSALIHAKPKKISMTTQTDESVFLRMESGIAGTEQPIQPIVANHVFAHFPNSSPVHLREQPIQQSTNAQPLRCRLNAVSLDAENPPEAVEGRDTPDAAPQAGDIPISNDVTPQSEESVSSSTGLPTTLTFPEDGSVIKPQGDSDVVDGEVDGVVSLATDFDKEHADEDTIEDPEDSSSDEDQDDFMAKHPELKVNLHISEEDLSEKVRPNGPAESPEHEQEPKVPEVGQVPPNSEDSVKCNGIEDNKVVYEEDDSSSEDSSNSNSSSSSASLADPEGLPAILSLENHHAKEADGNLSWDEHGTPVIPQYACNPYALDLDDDFVNSQLYEPADFRLFTENLESPPPPPIGDRLCDVRDDQDPVPL